MRERVEHGEVGRAGSGQAAGRRPGRWADRWVRRWDGRRPAPGPRPVRPAGALVLVRPLEAPRPVREPVPAGGADLRRARAWSDGVPGGASGPRLLVRPACPSGRAGARSAWRRAVAAIAMVAASAAVVVALGLLARVAEPAPAPAAVPVAVPAPVVVTVEPGETVWDVAARVAPGRPGVEVAAVAERIVADNALRSVRPEPGQVLRVAGG
jgi:nucleoid-associated protein YgaU